jgi:WD repeat-containing protein 35
MRLGDWFRVLTLLESRMGERGDKKEDLGLDSPRKLERDLKRDSAGTLSEDQDQLLITALNHLGDYYSDRQDWRKAQEYYEKSKNSRALVRCAYRLDDYQALTALIEQIPERDEALLDLGEKFMSVGLCDEAVAAFLKGGDAKAAINCCVHLHFWDAAVRLAEEYKFPEIDVLLTKYGTYLLSKSNVYQAIDVYRKAKKHVEASKLLWDLGQRAGANRANPQPLRAKKLHVLAALERQKVDAKDSKDHGKIWHGAEAYHLWLLAHKQLYGGASATSSSGATSPGAGSPGGSPSASSPSASGQASQLRAAMRTALRLADYDDVLDPKDIFSLIALLTFYNKFLGQCSRALTKLETLDTLTSSERERYQQLALAIYTSQSPTDPSSDELPCPNTKCKAKVKEWSISCTDCNSHFSPCLLSGRPLLEEPGEGSDARIWTCKVCRHHILRSELSRTSYTYCPLCHFSAISQVL